MNAKKMHERISNLEFIITQMSKAVEQAEWDVERCQEAVIESNKKTKALGFAVTFGLTSVCIALFWLN